MSSKLVKSTVKSSWTPLNHEDSNNKVFEERRALTNKWFEKWTTSQRKTILEDLLLKCTGNQVEYAKSILSSKAIQNHVDFTRMLPRVVCLYIFSYLDPRSLCRASQVCWYWKYLAEANEIWAPKCARLGWFFTGTVNTMDAGFWKTQFIDNIHYLQVTRPAKIKEMQEMLLQELTTRDVAKHNEEEERLKKERRLKEKQLQAHNRLNQPWRGPDPKPIDIVRNNYIDNDEDNGSRIKTLRQNSKQYSRRVSHDLRLNSTSKPTLALRPYSISPYKNTVSPTCGSSSNIDDAPSHDTYNHQSLSLAPDVNSGDHVIVTQDISSTHMDDIPSGRPWAVPVDHE